MVSAWRKKILPLEFEIIYIADAIEALYLMLWAHLQFHLQLCYSVSMHLAYFPSLITDPHTQFFSEVPNTCWAILNQWKMESQEKHFSTPSLLKEDSEEHRTLFLRRHPPPQEDISHPSLLYCLYFLNLTSWDRLPDMTSIYKLLNYK